MQSVDDIIKKMISGGGWKNINEMLGNIMKEIGVPTYTASMSEVLSGFGRRPGGVSLPRNSDMTGITFFTRPELNMTVENLINDRRFTPLLVPEPDTLGGALRSMLDIRLNEGNHLFDHKQAFIPMLSNLLTSANGWPDIKINPQYSKPGIYKEVWMMNDSITDINDNFDLTCSFHNVVGDPISLLFATWLRYMGQVYIGEVVPYPEKVVENEIDYMTRIYHFLMDPGNRYIQGVVACGAAIPVGLSMGAKFQMTREDVYNKSVDDITVSFACLGCMYNDPILLKEFNETVIRANPDMGVPRNSLMSRVDPKLSTTLNFKGYPFINEYTSELEWYMYTDEYRVLNRYANNEALV